MHGTSRLVVGIDGRELSGRPTGTGRYLRSLLRHWRDAGDRLILYFAVPPPDDPILDHASIAVRAVGEGRGSGLVWQERLLPRAARADALDAFFSPAYSCPLSLDVPRVTAVHDLSFFSHPQDFSFLEGLRRRILVSLSLRASRRVLVCSDFTRRELSRRFPDLSERALLVPLGADEDLPTPPSRVEARRRLSLTGPSLITVGAILNRRCLPELLRATRRLVPRHPDLVLDVVGENRTQPRLDLHSLVTAHDLVRHVRLSGFVTEAGLADRYAAADAAIFLSEYEGFGLPALEAAARGVPLVVSRAPSLGEIFGGAGVLVDPHSEAEIARQIDRVLSDPALRGRLAAAGRALAARHSWSETAASTREALLEAARW
jgi:glycosyltransferase involved in cell wall biosynthesis